MAIRKESTIISDRPTFAARIWRDHGDEAPVHIASKIGEFAAIGDAGGVAFWTDIARLVDGMMREKRQ